MEQRTTDFQTFWNAYPRRVGKLAAQRAYAKARTQATAAEILDAIDRYKRHKPDYADYAHPSTWLNAGRWMDEYDEPKTLPPSLLDDWFHECQELHNGECGGSLRHRTKMLIERDKKAAGL